jgi:hypothetical protein
MSLHATNPLKNTDKVMYVLALVIKFFVTVVAYDHMLI